MRFCKVFLSVLLVATLAVSLVACKPAATEPVTYTVTFDYNYDGAPAPYTVEVEEGDRATKPADPDRPDYTFKGWFVDKECLIEETFLSSGVTQSPINKITADTTFYAGWTEKVAKAELVSVTAVYVGKPVELNAPLNTSFVSVTATYSDQTTKKVSEFEVSTLDSSTIGVKTLTVTYTEDGITKTCTFSVEVVDSTAPQPGGDTIYFKSEDGWTTVNVYTYEPELIGGWPGEPMTAVDGQDGWFSYSFEEGMTPNKLIFNNGTAQTGNLTYDGENNYYAYNDLTGAGQWGADFTVQAPAVAPTYRLYFYNTDGWATVNAYAWTGSLKYTGEWPGTAMTADTENNGWYYIDVNQNAVNVIFNDGTNQTDNLEIDGVNNYYVYGDKWYPTLPCIHEYSGDCDATCNKCGAVRETTAEHTYDNDCDADCNVCGEVRAVEHRYVVKYDETNHWEECEICLRVKADSTQPHEFTMQHNSTHHWNECACGYVDESSREEHAYVDGFCTVCGAEQPEVPVVLESIEVTFTTQGVVFVNTEITASDVEVTKVMSNNERQPVTDTENVSVALKADNTNAVEGKAIYVVTYQGKTAEVEVTFTRKLTGITVTPDTLTVEYGGTLELTVTANYDGAESATVTDYTTNFANTTTGLQTVTVTYTENGITETTTVEVTVNELPKTTYYFYNADGWASVYAYAWMEEAVPVTPAKGDFVIMGDVLGAETQWTAEGSVKLFYNESANQYEFKGLRLSAGMQFKIVQLGETEHTYYNTLEQYVDASLYTYSSDGNIVIAKDGIYDFYFKMGTHELYFGTGTTESTPNMQVTSVTLTETWPGTAMTAVEGQDGWYSISVDERAQKIIFNDNSGNQTANLDLNAETPYYNGSWYPTMPCIHEYSGDCDATCNKCGAVRETTAEHTYDNDCDADCNVCGEVRAVEHRYVVKYDETNHWEECEICLSVKADSTQPHEFTMQHNSTHHWNECACGYVDESSREEHAYVDGFCTVCGAEQPEVPVVLESIEATFTTQGVVFVNTEITASDLEVTKVMSNGDKQPVSDTENVSVALKAGSTNAVEGKAIYVVTYQGKTAEVEVTFTRKLTGITVTPDTLTVEYEGTLELTVTANYDGAESATVTDYTTDFVNTTTGLQTVTVTYTENDITQTTTVEVTVKELPKTTYYFYNADGWASVYAYAWMEEAVPVTPATGDFVIMGDIGLGEAWTTDSSVKLFYNESANQYEFKGLRLSAGMQFKIVQLGETEHTYYNTLEQYVDASLYTYSSDGNIVIAKDGIYDFYFKMGTHELYFGTGTTESTPNMQVTSVTLTETWPGTAMTAVEGQDGWYSISIDERAQKIIFNDNSGNQTANLDLNAETPYYNGTEWVATIG